MPLMLIAQAQIARGGWFDFADQWGNTASVVGLALAVIAFPLTWWFQWRTKRAQQQALLRASFDLLRTAIDALLREIETAREAGRLGLWLRAFDCCHRAKAQAVRLVGNAHLTTGEIGDLRCGADDLTLVIEYIERNKLRPDAPAAFQQDKREKLDRLSERLTAVQTRLGARQWEVWK